MRPRRGGGKVVLWDFHGTLVEEPGGWPQTLLDVLDRHEPGHGLDREAIRPFLKDGFPWHRPAEPHPELADGDSWWASLEPLFSNAFASVGIKRSKGAWLARQVRTAYIESGRYRVFDDTLTSLRMLASAGWRHAILSNHVPELPLIVESLGLLDEFEIIINSADTGYEKPHPRAYEIALDSVGHPERVWMVGDNPDADVIGAEKAGIPAILARREDPRCPRMASDLAQVAAMILNSEDRASSTPRQAGPRREYRA